MAVFILFGVNYNKSAFSWDNNVTHIIISKYALNSSILGANDSTYLQILGFSRGTEEFLTWNNSRRQLQDWLAEGTKNEDGNLRELNHFFNPLMPWSEAGLWSASRLWNSTVVWAQNSNAQAAWNRPIISDPSLDMPWDFSDTTPINDWSWQTTRGYYYSALTAANDVDHQANFAKMFRGLGQQMHLLQDMSVPAHVRNDSHLFKRWIEEWAASKIPSMPDLLKVAPNPIVPAVTFSSTNDALAPIPVARLFDTKQYNGKNPEVTNPLLTMNNIGLAEYVNANFVSAGTIFSSAFTYPSQTSSVQIVERDIPGGTMRRQYYCKTADGDSGYLLAGVGYFQFYADANNIIMGPTTVIPPMDDNVHAEYAAKLLPRAVGYSAALLNYFFRGNIEITLPDKGVYGIVDNTAKPVDPNFKEIRLKVRNTTSTGEEMSSGTIQLVVSYRLAESDTFVSGYVPSYGPAHIEYGMNGYLNDLYHLVVNASDTGIISIPTGTPVELTFNLPANVDNPLSIKATDVRLQIVYRGWLGNEPDAVAVGMNDVSEPTPIGIANYMDYVCIKGAWYAAGSPEALQQVDANQNGIADPLEGDIYPHGVTDIYLKFSSMDDNVSATTSSYTAKLAGVAIPPGSIINHAVYILTDPYFTMSDKWTVTKSPSNDTSSESGSKPGVYLVDSVQRQDNWVLPEYFESRGTTHWYFFAPLNRSVPSSGPECSIEALEGVAPPFQSIP
jgi:hypothetical protein